MKGIKLLATVLMALTGITVTTQVCQSPPRR